MRIQLASDLHLEHLQHHHPGERLLVPSAQADLLVLAGDIASGSDALRLFGNWPVPVLYVAGNHEFYGLHWEHIRAQLRVQAQGSSVQFLDNDVADLSRHGAWSAQHAHDLARVRFLGCTLWTDYQLRCNRTRSQLMANAELRLADHRFIRTNTGPFTPEVALDDHERSRAWLKAELAKPFEGKTVVISHHGPHPLSVHPRYAGDPLNACFVSDLSELVTDVDVWLHGHVHDSFDYSLGRCRVVANPRGYARSRRADVAPREFEFENPAFGWTKLIEV